MTKQQEIDAIRHFTQDLPVESYLRPWLESILPQIAADIRNDFPVQPHLATPERARVEAERILTDAKAVAENVRKSAHADADRIRKEAVEESTSVRQRANRELLNCVRTLGFSV